MAVPQVAVEIVFVDGFAGEGICPEDEGSEEQQAPDQQR